MLQTSQEIFADYIRNRIERNKNFIGLFTGQTGSGKSYSCLSLAETIDPNFNISRICFDAKEFMTLVNTNNLPKGSVIILEETGVSMSSRNWYSLTNKVLGYYFQTARSLNQVLLLNTPDSSFLDAQVRRLIHCNFEMVTIDKSKQQSICKPFLIQNKQGRDKPYRKYLRINTPDGLMRLNKLRLKLPSKELRQKYEEKKLKFLQLLNASILRDIEKAEEKDTNKPLTTKQLQLLDLFKSGKLIPEICAELDITHHSVYEMMNSIKKKGINITPIKENVKIIRYEVKHDEHFSI